MINILKKELREIFRDKKSLMMMLLAPILIPIVIIGMSALFNMMSNKPISDYNKIGFDYELNETEKELATKFNIAYIIKDKDKLKNDYENGIIDLYVTKENNKYILNGYNNETSTYSLSIVNPYFNAYKEILQKEYLENKSINSDEIFNIITVEDKLIDKDNFIQKYLLNYAFSFILMAMTMSAIYPATDSTAGEKERGTLETLLTFPIKSKDIIMGKFLATAISSFVTGIISIILADISLIIANKSFDVVKMYDLSLNTPTIIFSVIVALAFSLLVSGLAIALASKSKTYKEAQSALTPLNFIAIFPGMIVTMIDISSTYLLSAIPFVNFSLLFDDMTSGNLDILKLIIMFASTIIFIFVVLSIIIKQYKSEKVLFSN